MLLDNGEGGQAQYFPCDFIRQEESYLLLGVKHFQHFTILSRNWKYLGHPIKRASNNPGWIVQLLIIHKALQAYGALLCSKPFAKSVWQDRCREKNAEDGVTAKKNMWRWRAIWTSWNSFFEGSNCWGTEGGAKEKSADENQVMALSTEMYSKKQREKMGRGEAWQEGGGVEKERMQTA